jgi:hypothetical protein
VKTFEFPRNFPEKDDTQQVTADETKEDLAFVFERVLLAPTKIDQIANKLLTTSYLRFTPKKGYAWSFTSSYASYSGTSRKVSQAS